MSTISRSGVQGMRWYHRYHQSYKIKPTRSGKVGEEHLEAKAQRNNDNSYDNFKIMDKKTIKQINSTSKRNPADFSRREMGLTSDRVIPAGTKIYRTTINPKEGVDGPKYVSYFDVDRDLYKGGWVRQTGKSKDSYENTYTLKEDLKIPNNDTVNKVINKVILKDKLLTKEALEVYDKLRDRGSGTVKETFERVEKREKRLNSDDLKKDYDLIKKIKEEDPKYDTYDTSSYDAFVKDMKSYIKEYKRKLRDYYGTDKYSEYIDRKVKDLREMPMNEATFLVAQTYGLNTNAKKKVMDELKKQGYNAMPDYASIGGVGKYMKEGVDPLIIFDGSNSLDKKKVSQIEGKSINIKRAIAVPFVGVPGVNIAAIGALIALYKEQNAADRYSEWNKKANSKDTTWRGSFIMPNDLLRINMNDINLNIIDIVNSGVI